MMKALMRLLVVSAVLAVVLLPLTALADALPAPLEKKLSPGVHTVSYAGQNLRFDSPVSLVVRFEPVSTSQIRLTVRVYGAPSGAQGSSSSSEVTIYWENFESELYNGPPPVSSDWSEVLNTESGFTEK